jgi:hypothetical protein
MLGVGNTTEVAATMIKKIGIEPPYFKHKAKAETNIGVDEEDVDLAIEFYGRGLEMQRPYHHSEMPLDPQTDNPGLVVFRIDFVALQKSKSPTAAMVSTAHCP